MPMIERRLQRPAERSRMQRMPVEPFHVEAGKHLAHEGGHGGPANDRREPLARFLRARFRRAVAARCFHADRHPLHQTLKRRLANRQRLHASQRNRCRDSRQQSVLRAQVLSDARESELVETEPGPDHRDDADQHQQAHDADEEDADLPPRQRLSRSDPPDRVAHEARPVPPVGHPIPHRPKQPGLPQQAVRRPDENHAAVVEHAVEQELAQRQVQQRS